VDGADYDLCSHGRLRLTIGGCNVSDGSQEFGISETALALLRTLEADHNRTHPVADRLVFHGCGLILMMGCPIGIDWIVEHNGTFVDLRDIVVYPTVNESEAILKHDCTARVPVTMYRDSVIAFASAVEHFFEEAAPRRIEEDFDRTQYEEFWQEFRAIFRRQR